MRGKYRSICVWLIVPMFFSLFPSFVSGDMGPALTGLTGAANDATSVIPGLFYVHPYNERLSLGASVNVPSGIGYNFGKQWSGRYHVTETSLAFVAGTGVAAYKVTDKLSLAAPLCDLRRFGFKGTCQ